MKKLFSIILIVLGIIGTCIGGYFGYKYFNKEKEVLREDTIYTVAYKIYNDDSTGMVIIFDDGTIINSSVNMNSYMGNWFFNENKIYCLKSNDENGKYSLIEFTAYRDGTITESQLADNIKIKINDVNNTFAMNIEGFLNSKLYYSLFVKRNEVTYFELYSYDITKNNTLKITEKMGNGGVNQLNSEGMYYYSSLQNEEYKNYRCNIFNDNCEYIGSGYPLTNFVPTLDNINTFVYYKNYSYFVYDAKTNKTTKLNTIYNNEEIKNINEVIPYDDKIILYTNQEIFLLDNTKITKIYDAFSDLKNIKISGSVNSIYFMPNDTLQVELDEIFDEDAAHYKTIFIDLKTYETKEENYYYSSAVEEYVSIN